MCTMKPQFNLIPISKSRNKTILQWTAVDGQEKNFQEVVDQNLIRTLSHKLALLKPELKNSYTIINNF
jgi:hypothetical protein